MEGDAVPIWRASPPVAIPSLYVVIVGSSLSWFWNVAFVACMSPRALLTPFYVQAGWREGHKIIKKGRGALAVPLFLMGGRRKSN